MAKPGLDFKNNFFPPKQTSLFILFFRELPEVLA